MEEKSQERILVQFFSIMEEDHKKKVNHKNRKSNYENEISRYLDEPISDQKEDLLSF